MSLRFSARLMAGVGLVVFYAVLAGCDGGTKPAGPTGKSNSGGKTGDDHGGKKGHAHKHGEKGPHGGALVAIGDDAAHLEVTLDAETGRVTAFVLDGNAENPIPIQQKSILLAVTLEHGHEHEAHAEHSEDEKEKEDGKEKHDELPQAITIELGAVEPAADGTSAQFSAEIEQLKGADEFDAVLASITIDGKDFKQVGFNYPKGNEHDHHH
jgi:hypothetical protein